MQKFSLRDSVLILRKMMRLMWKVGQNQRRCVVLCFGIYLYALIYNFLRIECNIWILFFGQGYFSIRYIFLQEFSYITLVFCWQKYTFGPCVQGVFSIWSQCFNFILLDLCVFKTFSILLLESTPLVLILRGRWKNDMEH